MTPDHFHTRSQPEEPAFQPYIPYLSVDPFPRVKAETFNELHPPQPGQYSISTATPNIRYTMPYHCVLPALTEWSELPLSDYQYTTDGYNYGFPPNLAGVNGDGLTTMHDGLPRGADWSSFYDPRTPAPFCYVDGFPTGYQPGSLGGENFDKNADSYAWAYEFQEPAQERAHLSINSSPTTESHSSSASPPEFINTPDSGDSSSSKGSEDGEPYRGKGNVPLCGQRITDEPYAKLIYRALKDAPNHSMVLQDIYSWFRKNTDKGKSKSSGWRNSIRHNLSMNAVSILHDSTAANTDTLRGLS